jgi:hypothetical protein
MARKIDRQHAGLVELTQNKVMMCVVWHMQPSLFYERRCHELHLILVLVLTVGVSTFVDSDGPCAFTSKFRIDPSLEINLTSKQEAI